MVVLVLLACYALTATGRVVHKLISDGYTNSTASAVRAADNGWAAKAKVAVMGVVALPPYLLFAVAADMVRHPGDIIATFLRCVVAPVGRLVERFLCWAAMELVIRLLPVLDALSSLYRTFAAVVTRAATLLADAAREATITVATWLWTLLARTWITASKAARWLWRSLPIAAALRLALSVADAAATAAAKVAQWYTAVLDRVTEFLSLLFTGSLRRALAAVAQLWHTAWPMIRSWLIDTALPAVTRAAATVREYAARAVVCVYRVVVRRLVIAVDAVATFLRNAVVRRLASAAKWVLLACVRRLSALAMYVADVVAPAAVAVFTALAAHVGRLASGVAAVARVVGGAVRTLVAALAAPVAKAALVVKTVLARLTAALATAVHTLLRVLSAPQFVAAVSRVVTAVVVTVGDAVRAVVAAVQALVVVASQSVAAVGGAVGNAVHRLFG